MEYFEKLDLNALMIGNVCGIEMTAMSKAQLKQILMRAAREAGKCCIPSVKTDNSKTDVSWVEVDEATFGNEVEKIMLLENKGKATLIHMISAHNNAAEERKFLNWRSQHDMGTRDTLLGLTEQLSKLTLANESKVNVGAGTSSQLNNVQNHVAINNSERDILKPNNLPKFYGDRNGSIEEWIFILDELFAQTNTTEERKTAYILPLHRKNALFEYRSLAKKFANYQRLVKWNDIKQHFRVVFNDEDVQRKLRKDLTELSNNGGKSHEEYVDNFLKIKSRLTDYPESELVFDSKNGLRDGIEQMSYPKSLRKVMEYWNWSNGSKRHDQRYETMKLYYVTNIMLDLML